MKLNIYKQILGLLCFIAFLGLSAISSHAQNLYRLDFDSLTTNSGYVESFFDNDGPTSNNYCDTSSTGFSGNYNGSSGTFFAAQDIDDAGASTTTRWTMNIDDIDISTASSLAFSIDLAEDDDGSSQDWDLNDSFIVIATIDGGTPDTILRIGSVATNQEPSVIQCSEASLIGTKVTDDFTTFSGDFSGTGSLLDILMVANFQFGDEDIAFDNFMIAEDFPDPPCSMTDIVTYNWICDNNGSGSDTTDDFWTIGIEPVISNPGATNKFDVVFDGLAANPMPDTAMYATMSAFFSTAPGSAGGGNFNITARDVDDPSCMFSVVFDDVAEGGHCSDDPPPPAAANVMVHAEEGDVYVENLEYGVIIKSPDGSCFRITVADDGTLSTESVTCP